MGVPDLKFINRRIPIKDVADKLDLRIGTNGNIHCWRHEAHQHGDRTASVGIQKATNAVKCFGCGIGPLGVTDFVMSVLGTANPGEAARWIAERFEVPELPRGQHLVDPKRHIFQWGRESEIGLLVHSGLWALLSPTAQAIVPVMLELGDRVGGTQDRTLRISYRALGRYSGVKSPNAIAHALRELQEIHWLTTLPRQASSCPVRETSTYLITARSDELTELAQTNFAQTRSEIDIERQLRSDARRRRKRALLTK
jgi:hypothetical protein